MVKISKKNLLVPALDESEIKKTTVKSDKKSDKKPAIMKSAMKKSKKMPVEEETTIAETEAEKNEEKEGSDNEDEDNTTDEESSDIDEEDQAAIDDALKSALPSHPKSKSNLKNRVSTAEMKKRGILYIGHIPNGFAEPQIKTFFSQFGEVTRLRVARSSKTGRMKGYCWIEFEMLEVAQIVADTMKNYMLYGKTLKVALMPHEVMRESHPNLFKKSTKKIRATGRTNQKKAKIQHNNRVLKNENGDKKIIQTKRQEKRQKKKAEEKTRNLKEVLGLNLDDILTVKKETEKKIESPKKTEKKTESSEKAEKKRPSMKKKASKK